MVKNDEPTDVIGLHCQPQSIDYLGWGQMKMESFWIAYTKNWDYKPLCDIFRPACYPNQKLMTSFGLNFRTSDLKYLHNITQPSLEWYKAHPQSCYFD